MDPLVNGLAYFAEGVQRHCVTYLRDLVQNMPGTTMSDLQLLGNFLPEFGSLPWAMKPLMCYVTERFQIVPGVAIRASALVCAVVWFAFASHADGFHYWAIVLFSAAASFASAASDALVDGLIAEQSATESVAVEMRSASEYGRLFGGVLTGILAWGGGLTFVYIFAISGLAWFVLFSVFSCGARADGTPHSGIPRRAPTMNDFFKSHVILIAAVTFLVCVAPTCDLFQYRKMEWKFSASDQTFVSTVSAVGWISGVTFYKKLSGRGGWNWLSAFKVCLLLWCSHPPISILVMHLAKSLVDVGQQRSFLIMAFAVVDKSFANFATAMTFMPCNVGMQLAIRSGTGFALLQLVGALGSAVGRNLDFRLQMNEGVTVEDVHDWPQVVMWSGAVRVLLAVVVAGLIPNLWDGLECSMRKDKKRDSPRELDELAKSEAGSPDKYL